MCVCVYVRVCARLHVCVSVRRVCMCGVCVRARARACVFVGMCVLVDVGEVCVCARLSVRPRMIHVPVSMLYDKWYDIYSSPPKGT